MRIRAEAGAPTYDNANIFCPYSINSREGHTAWKQVPDGNSLQEIRKFLGRDSKKRLGRNWLYQIQFRLDLSRKIIRIFLRIAAYPVFFAVMALELPIDCTRIPIRHLFPGGRPFHASVFESYRRYFRPITRGAPAYAALLCDWPKISSVRIRNRTRRRTCRPETGAGGEFFCSQWEVLRPRQ